MIRADGKPGAHPPRTGGGRSAFPVVPVPSSTPLASLVTAGSATPAGPGVTRPAFGVRHLPSREQATVGAGRH